MTGLLLGLVLVIVGKALSDNLRERRATRREIARLEARLACEPDRADAWLALGDLYGKLGDRASAKRCWRRALELGADRVAVVWKIQDLERPGAEAPASLRPMVLRELKLFPAILLACLGAALLLVLFFYLLRFLPAWLTFIILLVLPTGFFLHWLAR